MHGLTRTPDALSMPMKRSAPAWCEGADQGKGVKSPPVLEAIKKIPRHCFVPKGFRDEAYDDHPLPIGMGQTISQPYIVALMTELLDLKPTDRVLEIGTGSGYHSGGCFHAGQDSIQWRFTKALETRHTYHA